MVSTTQARVVTAPRETSCGNPLRGELDLGERCTNKTEHSLSQSRNVRHISPKEILLPRCSFHAGDKVHHCPVTE